jgi:DNA-binding MarR family transcriptional regulator
MPRRSAPQSAAAAPVHPSPTAPLLDALRALRRELRVLERDTGDVVGLPPAQAQVLRSLAESPAPSLAALAERMHTDPSSASVVVQRLVEAGLVARTPAPYDRRRTELALTTAGRTRLRRRPGAEERLAEAVAQLGQQRSAALARELTALASTLREPPER